MSSPYFNDDQSADPQCGIGPSPDDASTGVTLGELRNGGVFRTASGFRGIKRNNLGGYQQVEVVSYEDGSYHYPADDTECWEIKLGGFPPRKEES
jgi:hypothetical protein